MKYVIVGGVAGGAAVAARLRRNDESAEILIFEKGNYISYANCGLPYYVGGSIKDREKLFLESPESFKKNLNIDVKTGHEVLSIDKENKTVKVQQLSNSDIYSEKYDKLILSPGATPIIPPISGIDNEKVFTLRNVPDADRLKKFIDQRKPTSAIVVGAGFIGMEAAENLYDRGLNVSIVEMADQVMTPLDFEMAAQVHEHLKYKEVALYLSDGVKSLKDLGNRMEITLASGKKLYTDVVVLSIGVKPLTVLAESAGLETGRGIVVNQKMETSAKDIYALGDAAEIKHGITGKESIVPLAGPAGKQARILADNLVYGTNKEYKGAIGTSIAKIFDITVATTGLPEKMFIDDKDVLSVIVNGSSHAGYYPGAMQLFLKLVFKKDGQLLGAQGVGFDGVDKRIEMIAAVIRMGGSVTDLTEVEHAYAPPFSSSKDPVNILGFTAENVMLRRSNHTTWKQFDNIYKNCPDNYTLLDIRTDDERELHPITNTISMDKSEVRDNLNKIPKDKDVIILCSGGLRAYLTERILKQSGFNNVSILSGGLNIYFSAAKDQNNFIEFENMTPHRNSGEHITEASGNFVDVDACGLQCPGPILKLKQEIEKVPATGKIRVTASDPGFYKDVTSWCNMTGNKILGVEQSKGQVVAMIEKSVQVEDKQQGYTVSQSGNEVTIICFSDDMDKALASMVIANGAVASGKKVTIFFTFWGLSIIKKVKKGRVKKSFLGKMFGVMLPNNMNKLGLSKMNMGGMGAFMMKGIMNKLKIDNLQTMLNTLIENKTNLIACQMSMDVMGVKKDELMDAVEIGGVANYLESASTAGINLFI